MKVKTGVHLSVALVVLFAVVSVFPLTADAQTIHALLLIDDGNPRNFGQHVMSGQRIKNLLRKIERTLKIDVKISVLGSANSAESPDFPTAENIKKWIDRLNIGNEDVVFVYASAHGGARQATRELYLDFSQGAAVVERPPIAKALEGLPCRLKIFITDACSYGVEIYPPTFNPDAKLAYEQLFFQHKGFLNVASATEGEVAGGDTMGGWFTVSLVEVLEDPFPHNTDTDDFMSWKEVFDATKQKTEERFRKGKPEASDYWKEEFKRIGQVSQRPKYFGQLPRRVRN